MNSYALRPMGFNSLMCSSIQTVYSTELKFDMLQDTIVHIVKILLNLELFFIEVKVYIYIIAYGVKF